MGSYLLRKGLYGLLVLLGVVTLVFFLFNLSPGDPVRNLVGENAPQEVVDDLRRKLDLDLPLGQRFLLYLNDLSPLSVHNPTDAESRISWERSPYSGKVWWTLGEHRALAVKWPYLKRSFLTDRPVSEVLAEVMPGTAVLAVVSIGLAMLAGLVLGMFAALHKDAAIDRFILVVSALGMAGPSFFVAILVAWIGAVHWRDQIVLPLFPLLVLGAWLIAPFSKRRIPALRPVAWSLAAVWLLAEAFRWWKGVDIALLTARLSLPGTGLDMTGSLYEVDPWKGKQLALSNMVLPVVTLMIRPLAVIVQLTRSSLLDVLSQDYIRTARAKGLSERTIVVRHALRNALNPVVTAVSGWFASLLAGAVFVEFVFGWKGLGQEMFTAIEKQDLPVVMGGVILIAAIFVLINLLVDFIYGWIDPRVR